MATTQQVQVLPTAMEGLSVAGVCAAGTVAAYVGFLGGDQNGNVIGLTVAVVALAVWAAWRRQAIVATLIISAVLTLAFSMDASSMGALLLLVGSLAGLGLVGAATETCTNRARR